MPLHGARDNSFEKKLWGQRILSTMNDYKNFAANELPHLPISGKYSEYLKRILDDLYKKMSLSLDTLTMSMLSSNVANVLNASTRYNVSRTWHTVLDIAQNTSNIPEELYFFVDSVYDRLGGETVPYFIMRTLTQLVPGTLDICKYVLRPFVINLKGAYDYLENKKAYVIFTTPSIVKNPVDWPLLVHETAHILEEEKLQIAQQYYPQLKDEQFFGSHNLSATSGFSVDVAVPNWALEISCDIISTISCGPIFGYRLLDNFLRPEKYLSETHPPTKKRLKLISDELEKYGWKEAASDIRDKTKRIKLPNFIERTPLPEHTHKIIKRIRTKSHELGIEYQCTPAVQEHVKIIGSKLNSLKPCITVKGESVDLKDLLNASEYVEVNIKETQEFKDFMADMIRLVVAKDHFTKMKKS
jgi:hypothetical protein